MKKTVLALTFLTLISCGKSDIKSELVGKWDFRNMFNPNNEVSNYDQEIGDKEIDDLGNENFFGSYYVINEDKSYYSLHTEGEGGYIEGTWEYNEKDSLLLFYSSNKTQQKAYKLNYLKNKQLSFSDPNPKKVNPKDHYLKQLGDNLNHRYKFVKEDYTLDSDFNYTEKKYNLWRIKPSKPETEIQIKNRAKQAMDYAILFLKNNLDQDKNFIRLNAVNLPINFYGNGVEMRNFEESYAWKNIFYNDDQAYSAYQIINKAMAADFEVPKNKKPIELSLYILEELNKTIK